MNSHATKLGCAVAVASAVVFGLAACSSSGSSSDGDSTAKATLALNFSPSGLDLPVYTALAKGYYKDAGIDLSVLITKSGQDAINAVQSGRAQIGTANLPYLAISEAQGVNTLSVGNRIGTHTFGLFIPKKNGSDNLKSLVGKTVLAASSGIIEETKGILQANGVDPDKVKFATISAPSLLSTYAGGQGDAMATSVPFGGPAVQGTRPSYELNYSSFGATIPDYTYFVRPGAEKTNAKMIEAFLKATYRGLGDDLKDPTSAANEMAKQVQGLNAKTILAQWRATVPFLCSPGATQGSSVAQLNEANWTNAGQTMAKLGITTKVVDTKSMVTNQFTSNVTTVTCPAAGS